MDKWKIAILLILLSIAGIYYYENIMSNIEDNADELWKRASVDYSCSYDQYSKVMLETNYCKAETRFTGRYCYSAAIIRNCSKIPTTK